MITSVERERFEIDYVDDHPWRVVVRGLDLALVSLSVFAALPAVAYVLWSVHADARWWLTSVAVAAVPDAAGRWMCFSAPIARKMPIALSLACQFLAFVALAALAYCSSQIDLALGLVLVACFQAGAAVCFTVFLRRAASSLGRDDVVSRTDALGWTLFSNFLITAAVAAVACVLLAALLAMAAWNGPSGPDVTAVATKVIFEGLGIVVGGLLAVMYWNYALAMSHLRKAIVQQLAASTGQLGQ
ncbi:MAG: hypothetical protein ACTHK7_18735 [Aureliella sp.]